MPGPTRRRRTAQRDRMPLARQRTRQSEAESEIYGTSIFSRNWGLDRPIVTIYHIQRAPTALSKRATASAKWGTRMEFQPVLPGLVPGIHAMVRAPGA